MGQRIQCHPPQIPGSLIPQAGSHHGVGTFMNRQRGEQDDGLHQQLKKSLLDHAAQKQISSFWFPSGQAKRTPAAATAGDAPEVLFLLYFAADKKTRFPGPAEVNKP